ncbi:MAG: transcriptional regulator [Muribaculaceae bacterium]|nr:transcriptional regulator [Muribaculaceae bacterium]
MSNSPRICIYIFVLLFTVLHGAAQNCSVEDALCRLDSIISLEDVYTRQKLARISELKRQGKNKRSLEERYWHNRSLYDEYFVFDADSAMHYVKENIAIARMAQNPEWENEWKIKRAFILSVMGLLKDAEDELADVDVSKLSNDGVGDYYAQRAYLYSHLSQLSGHRLEGHRNYDELSHAYQDSTFNLVGEDNPEYLWHKGSSYYDNPVNTDSIIEELKRVVDNSSKDSRLDAINAYVLARLYGDKGNVDEKIRYLAISGSIDVATSNRDIASLEELADILTKRGDIDRAYTYINYCQQQALNLPNRVRAASLARTEAEVHKLYVNELCSTGNRLTISLRVLCLFIVLLVLLTCVVVNRSMKLAKSRRQLEDSNNRLNANIKELSQTKESQESIMHELKAANEEIRHINDDLNEANYVKEECIGATFALCSSYMDRLEEFRKSVARLVRSNSWGQLRDIVADPAFADIELKEFYKNFDTLFLNIYPDFVKDFNELLRPDARISVKPGELNTELRIYALVRLGINDSVKIASLLHCSPQTVYNYRLRTRNKALVAKDTFADTVKSLGKYHK